MAAIIGTGIDEEEQRRQREEADRIAREAAQAAEQEAAAQTERAQEEAQAATQQAEQQAQDEHERARAQMEQTQQADQAGITVATGPTNRPLTDDQSFLLNQRNYVRDTGTTIVKHNDLDRLPPELEDQRAMLEEKNRKGEIIPSAVNDWGTNRISIDFDTIKSNDQAAYFATTLATDSDKIKFFKEYAKRTGQNYYTLLNEAEGKLGTRLFATPQTTTAKIKTYNQLLGNQGLLDVSGESLDLNTANQAQIEQSIRLIPDPDKHKNAVTAYGKLCEARGWTYDADSLDFMDSADLTQSDYKKAVGEFNGLFTIGYTEENEQNYLDALADIQADYENPRVRRQMEEALKGSYEARTGKIAPTLEEIEAATQQEEADNAGMSWWGRLTSGVDSINNALHSLFGGKGEAEKPAPSPLLEEETEAGETDAETSSAETSSVTADAVPPSPEGKAGATGNAVEPGEVQGPVYQEMSPADVESGMEGGQETQGPIQKREGNTQPVYQSAVPYSSEMTDEEALAAYMKGYTLDERNLAQIEGYVGDATAMGLIYGVSTADASSDLDAVSSASLTPDAASMVNTYTRYGRWMGAAANVLSSGSLPDGIYESAALELMSVEQEVRRIVSNPANGISVPRGENMYDYVLGLPEYEGLKNRVDAVAGAQKQINEIYAENALAERNAHQTDIENWKAAIMAGNGTPEMAAAVAAETDNGYIDISDDELYWTYKAQLRETGSYFSDGGRFWSGESAAAQEGRNLRAMGQGYGEYKSELKAETERTLARYTETAVRMGMTLEDYLSGAGIDSLDQIIDIAYNGMLATGNAYRNDPDAQEAAQTLMAETTQSVGGWTAAAMGAEQGVKSYGESFMQTAYMALDAVTYAQTVVDLKDEYREQYGAQASQAYYADLMAYIASGALSEESAAELQDNIARARDIFDVGYEINPGFIKGLVRTGREELGKDVEALEAAAQTLPASERMLFNGFSGLTYSLTGMAVSTLAGGATGSAISGSAAGWGVPEFASSYDENRAKGMSPGMAGRMALASAAGTTLLNMGGTGSQIDTIFGDTAYTGMKEAFTSKGATGLMKQMAAHLAGQAHQEGMEEVYEAIFGASLDLLDDAALAYDRGENPKLSAVLGSMVNNLYETDVTALGKEVLTSYVGGVAYGGIFSLGGVAKTGLSVAKGAKMQRTYASIDTASRMVSGDLPFTEENVGKVYDSLKKDLQDPKFCRWIDSAQTAAREQSNMVTAAMLGAGTESRKLAVSEANKASDYREKANAARSAADTAKTRWVELRAQVANGDLDAVAAMESARMQWSKAETTYLETSKAAQKAQDKASEQTREWLAACGAYSSQMMQYKTGRVMSERMAAAMEQSRLYDIRENQAQDEEAAQREVAYAEDYVFAEDEAEREAEAPSIDEMSDEALDSEIAQIAAQTDEAQRRIGDVEAQRDSLGLTDESIREIKDQELSPLTARKEKIIARETNRFNDAFDRIIRALEMDNEEAAGQIQVEYDRIGERLRSLGVDTDALIMAQYGVTSEDISSAEEAAKASEEDERYGKLTDSLSRRMEETSAKLEMLRPAREYLMKTPLYVNSSQAADILSSEGLKSISQFNRRYNTKLTTDEAKGAMPLDGHVLPDINSEAAGTVDVNADPVSELLRVLRSGKELSSAQKAEKAEARDLREKRKAADRRRRARVDAIVTEARNAASAKTQKKVNDYVDHSFAFAENPETTGKQAELLDYSTVSNKLVQDLKPWVDVTGYAHSLRDNDIRHIRNSHGEGTKEKYPVTADDIKRIPDIVENYDDVLYVKNKNKEGIYYVKRHNGTTYYLEAIKSNDRDGKNRLVNKQMIKVPTGTIPDIAGLKEAVENKWGPLHTTDDATNAVPSMYVQDVRKQSPESSVAQGQGTVNKNRATDWMASTRLQSPVGTTQESGSSTSIVPQTENNVNKNPNIDAMAEAAPSTPYQAAEQQGKKSKKLENSALKAITNLANKMGVGLRVKSGQRFQSADTRFGQEVRGYYRNGQRNAIVRATDAGRVSVVGHEIGHAVQEQIGLDSNAQMIASWQSTFGTTQAYTPEQYDHEAFAEFFWRYLESRDMAAEYAGADYVEAFEHALRQKKLNKAVSEAQRQVSSYINGEADAKIRAHMVDAYKAKSGGDTTLLRRMEIAIADDTAAAEDLQNVIRARTGEKHLTLEDNLRDTIRFNRRATARANECLTNAMVDQNGDVVYKSLKDAFSDAGVKGKDFDLFWEYELAKHSLDRDTVKGGKNQVFAEEAVSTEDRKAFVERMEREHPEFIRGNEEFQTWRRKFMDTYLVENGFLGADGKALMDALDAAYPNYVPTYRQKNGKRKKAAAGGRTYTMRTATGSTEDIIHPFDSFVGMVNSIVQMTADNDSKKKFADLYDRYGSPAPGETGPGMGLFANEITQDMERVSVSTDDMRKKITRMLEELGTDPDAISKIGEIIGDEKVEYRGTGRVNMDNVITVRSEDGSRRYFEIYNPELYTLLAGSGVQNQNGVLSGIAKATRMMSMLTTGSNPVFGVTNAMRDFQNSVNYGSWATSYLDGAVKWLGALKDVVTHGEASTEYDALGGGGWTAFDTRTKKGADQVRSEVFEGYDTSNVGRIGKMVGRKLWGVATFEKVNEAIEKTSRLAEYKYGKHDLSTTEGRIEAFLAAQDVTTDFARRGNAQIARDLKSLVPFFNASLQGVYRTVNQASAQERDRAGIRFAKNVVNATLASALANGMLLKYLDDDEKEEFYYLSDDLKAKHMFLPNFAPDIFGDAPLIRIPLDQNPVSYAVNAAVANFIWKGESDNEFVIELSAVADVIADNLNPISSTILDPVIATQTNRNWYGSNIVPSYLEGYDETNQYTEETPTLFVRASEGLAGVGVKISPMMLQYMAQQYTGYIGQTVIPALSSEKNQNGFVSGLLNALLSTTRKRLTSDPLVSNGVVSGVYDSYNQLNKVYKAGTSKRDFEIDYLNPALTDRQRKRAINEADDLIHSGGEIYEAKKEITAAYEKIDQINERNDLTDEEKYTLTSKVRRDMIETALDVQETMNDYDTRYRYNGIMPRWLKKLFLE